MATPPQTVDVNRRAVVARLGRALAKLGQQLKTDRRTGKLLLIDLRRQAIIDHDVDVETLARSVGSLAKWERMVD
jgi:hypothetical protein